MIKKTVQKTEDVYVCETCQSEFELEWLAERCDGNHRREEKQSKCEHDFEYSVEVDYDDREIEVTKMCKKRCGFMELVRVNEDDIASDIAKVLYELAKNQNN